jgi:Domain of unknown function (DUF4340)
MRKATRSLLLLLTLAIVLGGAVMMQIARESANLPLASLDPASVQRLEVRCAACTTRRFVRAAGTWRMLEPYALPADADAVEHLLAILHSPVRERRPMRDFDASKLGLDPAQVTLNFDDLSVIIGDQDPIGHDRYVRLGDDLLTVPDRFGARLLETAESELDRHLLPADVPVKSVSLHGEAARNDLASAWQSAMAIGVRPASSTGAEEIAIDVVLADGTHVAFKMLRDGTGYIARRSDPGLDYVLDEARAQPLLGGVQ